MTAGEMRLALLEWVRAEEQARKVRLRLDHVVKVTCTQGTNGTSRNVTGMLAVRHIVKRERFEELLRCGGICVWMFSRPEDARHDNLDRPQQVSPPIIRSINCSHH